MENTRNAPSPLVTLIIDLTERNMSTDQIRKQWKSGRYAGAADKHVRGYVEMLLAGNVK